MSEIFRFIIFNPFDRKKQNENNLIRFSPVWEIKDDGEEMLKTEKMFLWNFKKFSQNVLFQIKMKVLKIFF